MTHFPGPPGIPAPWPARAPGAELSGFWSVAINPTTLVLGLNRASVSTGRRPTAMHCESSEVLRLWSVAVAVNVSPGLTAGKPTSQVASPLALAVTDLVP